MMTRLFHTLNYEIKNSLLDCNSALDIGCGPDSPIGNCTWIKRSIGVEAFKPYLETSMAKGIHSEYINSKIEELDFDENFVDAVLLIDLIEHLPRDIGENLLNKSVKWARKKVLVSTPNGFVKQIALDGNPLQAHLSGWTLRDFNKLGFKTRGMAGLKILRQEAENESMSGDLYSSIRYRPKFFWFTISALSQLGVYFFPKFAFSLFSVKIKKSEL